MPFSHLQLPPTQIRLCDMIFEQQQNEISSDHIMTYSATQCTVQTAAWAILMRPSVTTALKWPYCYFKNVVTYAHNKIGSSPSCESIFYELYWSHSVLPLLASIYF